MFLTNWRAPRELQRLVEPVRDEALRREVQLLGWYPLAVDTDEVFDPVSREGLQPDPVAAAEVDDAPRLDAFHHQRDDRLGRPPRPIEPQREEAGRIARARHRMT